jgi:hypothetical protein
VRLTGVFGLLILIACSMVRANAVSLLPGSRLSQQAGSEGEGRDSVALTALPYLTTSSVIGNGGSAIANYDLQERGFDIAISHLSQNGQLSAESTGSVFFSVERRTSYQLSVVLPLPGDEASTGFLELRDLTSGDTLFADGFPAGGTSLAGGMSGQGTGSSDLDTSGLFTPEHEYSLRYSLSTVAPKGQLRTELRSGIRQLRLHMPLEFADADAVPLPPAVWGGTALIGLLGTRRALLGALRTSRL